MRWAALSFLLVTSACTNTLVSRSNGVLTYIGELNAEGLAKLKAADDGAAHTLRIGSGGGEVGVGMDFGEWVHARKLDVIVVDYCLSSCANYVFPAGRRKSIPPGSVVAWHGSAHQRDLPQQIASLPVDRQAIYRENLARMRAKEDAFFQRIGVSECIARIGIERLGTRGLYTMSVHDMRRFGIDNIDMGPTREQDIPPPTPWEIGVRFISVPAELDVSKACP